MSTSTLPAALRLSCEELAWLLGLRPGPAADLVGAALGGPVTTPAGAPSSMIERGLATDRRGETLPQGDAIVVGDVLTSAHALVSIGTAAGTAALLAVRPERVLMVATSGLGYVEVAAIDAGTSVGEAAAAIADRLGPGAVVMVAVPGGDITTVTGEVAAAVQRLIP